jgi:uncharacterized protein with HEPN domain
MQPKTLKYILDIESVIEEIEAIKLKTNNDYNTFANNMILLRAIERDLEIIGEAVRKILDINPNIFITDAKKIIGLRNIIAHAYESIDAEILWGIIQKNIPVLSQEVQKLKQSQDL